MKAPTRTLDPEKRTRILAAARGAFAERGYEKTSVAEIVRRAGVAHGTFYLYFPAKADLLPALIAEMQQSVMLAVAQHINPADPLPLLFRTLIETGLTSAESYRDIFDVVSPTSLFEPQAESAPSLMLPLLEARQVSGEIAPSLDLPVISLLLDGIMMQAARDLLLGDVSPTRERYIDETVNFLCRGLGIAKQ